MSLRAKKPSQREFKMRSVQWTARMRLGKTDTKSKPKCGFCPGKRLKRNGITEMLNHAGLLDFQTALFPPHWTHQEGGVSMQSWRLLV